MTKNPEWVQGLIDDITSVQLDDRQRAIVDYATKLTRQPQSVQESDVESLRRAGLDDSGILDVNLVCAYFAFVNRIADGLGVPLEAYWEKRPNP